MAGNMVPALCQVIHPVNQDRIHFTAGDSWLQKPVNQSVQ